MIMPTNGIAARMTLTNGNAAVIIDNWRRDHEFVIIASSNFVMLGRGLPLPDQTQTPVIKQQFSMRESQQKVVPEKDLPVLIRTVY